MSLRRLAFIVCFGTISHSFADAARAAPEIYFGYDGGFSLTPEGNQMRLTAFPNAVNAAQNWRGQLVMVDGYSFEASEGSTIGAVNPTVILPLFNVAASFSGGIVSDSASPGGVDDPAPDGPAGLYPTDGSQALYAPLNQLRIDFSEPVAAVGFFLVDVPDQAGFTVSWVNGSGSNFIGFPGPDLQGNGSVLFVGLVFNDPNEQVTTITIFVGEPGDQFALDEFLIGGIGEFCAADINRNGLIDSVDLARLLGAWGPGFGPEDVDDSGQVDAADLAILLSTWGACVPFATEARR